MPCSVNLNAFDSRFLSTCCKRFESVTRLRVRFGSLMDLEGEAAVFRFVAERAGHHVEQAGEEDLFGFDRHRARLDLRKVENVADQVEQVGSGAVNGARRIRPALASGCRRDCR